MAIPRKILLIDDHPDNRALLARTLVRKFPGVAIRECQELETTVNAAADEKFDAIILHRSNDADAVSLLKAIRVVNEHVPIVVVSGVDRSEVVLRAGANGFLNFDEWLRIGSVVENLLNTPESTAR